MQAVFICMGFYILLGAAGMAIGSRKADDVTKKARQLKFLTYLLIISIVCTSIISGYFIVTAFLILIAGAGEFLGTFTKIGIKQLQATALLIFILITAGFIHFAMEATPALQLYLYFLVFTFDAFSQVVGQ